MLDCLGVGIKVVTGRGRLEGLSKPSRILELEEVW